MSITSRRNSLRKSSISINSIRNTFASFSKGITNAKQKSDDILKQSISNKYVLKNENFIEKQIQTQMCIETMFKEMKGKIKYT